MNNLELELEDKYGKKLAREIIKATDEDQLCLVAISGDVPGMAGSSFCESRVVKFAHCHKKLVDDYLEYALKVELIHCRNGFNYNYASKEKKVISKFWDLKQKMRDCCIFDDKWQNRTSWRIAYYGEYLESQWYRKKRCQEFEEYIVKDILSGGVMSTTELEDKIKDLVYATEVIQ